MRSAVSRSTRAGSARSAYASSRPARHCGAVAAGLDLLVPVPDVVAVLATAGMTKARTSQASSRSRSWSPAERLQPVVDGDLVAFGVLSEQPLLQSVAALARRVEAV